MSDIFDEIEGDEFDEVEAGGAESAPLKALKRGLASRDAEGQGWVDEFAEGLGASTGSRMVTSLLKHNPVGQLANYVSGVADNPRRLLEDAGGLIESGVDLQTGKAASQVGTAIKQGGGGDLLAGFLEMLGRDAAHGGLDPKRPVSSPVNTVGIGSLGAGALQRIPSLRPPSRHASPLAKSFHKKGRALQFTDDAERARNYSRDMKVRANEILTKVDDLDTQILEKLKDHPRRAEIMAAKKEAASLKRALAEKVLGLSDDAEAAGGGVEDAMRALDAQQQKIDALMQMRRGESGASALGSAKGNLKTYEWKPAVNEAKKAARESYRASTDRMKANTALAQDPYAPMLTTSKGGNSLGMQWLANKAKGALAGYTPEQAFAREAALRHLAPKPGPGPATVSASASADDALARFFRELGLDPWEE